MLVNRIVSICIIVCVASLSVAMLVESHPARDQIWYDVLSFVQNH